MTEHTTRLAAYEKHCIATATLKLRYVLLFIAKEGRSKLVDSFVHPKAVIVDFMCNSNQQSRHADACDAKRVSPSPPWLLCAISLLHHSALCEGRTMMESKVEDLNSSCYPGNGLNVSVRLFTCNSQCSLCWRSITQSWEMMHHNS